MSVREKQTAGATRAFRGARAGRKGSGSIGKAIASLYYLPLYLREPSRTVVR